MRKALTNRNKDLVARYPDFVARVTSDEGDIGRGHLSDETHFAAILTAMKPRVSCNRDLGVSEATVNQGVGLTTVARIASLAGGKTLIVRGDAYHSLPGGGGRLPQAVSWQGVAIALEMHRAPLLGVRIPDALLQIETPRKAKPRFEHKILFSF